MRRTPALILGGGPAGAACAILLARAGRPHLLAERSTETGDAICGGFLSWQTVAALESLGVSAQSLNPAPVTQVRLFHGQRMAQAPLPQPGRAVSRRRLDTLLLARAIAMGASVERGLCASHIEGTQVQFRGGGSISADALFLATGKHDVRGLGRPVAARGADPTLGIRMRLAPSPRLAALIGDSVELHLVDRGYAGLVIQEDGSANLCMAVHRSRLSEAGTIPALMAEMARECPPLGDRLAQWVPGASDAIANVPYGWLAGATQPGIFRLGDQAGVIPSLAGEGMGIAVASGMRAGQAYVANGASGAKAYQRALASALRPPMALAGFIRGAGESPWTAPVLLALARAAPYLMHAAARWTRIPGQPVDADTRFSEGRQYDA